MPKVEEITYLVPEVNVTVTQAWINHIRYCQDNLPYGDIYLEINNGQPGKKIKEIPSIRFDKQHSVIKGEMGYIIQSLDMRIPKSWIDMILWVQEHFASGKIGYRLVSAQPTELLMAKQNVNFSRPETIPCGLPLNFSRS